MAMLVCWAARVGRVDYRNHAQQSTQLQLAVTKAFSLRRGVRQGESQSTEGRA
jgi:hypothetical protein